MGGGGADDGLAGGLGQLVLNIGTGDLGDGEAGLNLNDLGAVNIVLGGDLTASALHGLGDRVGDGMGKGKTGMGKVLGISLSISFPLTVMGNDRSSNGGLTVGVNDLLVHPLALDLLGGDGLSRADLLGSGASASASASAAGAAPARAAIEARAKILEFILNWMTSHDGSSRSQVLLNPFESR